VGLACTEVVVVALSQFFYFFSPFMVAEISFSPRLVNNGDTGGGRGFLAQ
jgi:hypothetical protein